MPTTVTASGTQTCVVDTTHVLTTGTGPTGGGVFVLCMDTSALTVGQWLEVEILRSILTGGTAIRYGGSPYVIPFASGWSESPAIRVPAGIGYTVRITQRGVAGGRAIPWSFERADA